MKKPCYKIKFVLKFCEIIVSFRLPNAEHHDGWVIVHCSKKGRHCELFMYSEV